jgi:TolB-like protein
LVLVILASLLPAAPAAATNLAVFNFQLKTGQEDWVWLEKFMSDQMATDLVQDRSLSVVARDRMQLMAQQMKWVPEFATTDAKVMGGIRSQLSIEYLVTGVCSVRDDQLEITAQIVEVQTRKEVHRKTVTGKTDQVIDLQKQLSADAMSWFTKRPAGEILKTLPMWTRSIPAVRALYEGMHLYDQGRYAEGWVKFRDASREDKNYVEAVYWVGKMYYFMYRYEHARRELERFVYLNCLHPRMGDAMIEYTHTFESSNLPPEELEALYRHFKDRFAYARFYDPSSWNDQEYTGAQWSTAKIARLQAQCGKPLEALLTAGPAMDTYGEPESVSIHSLLDHLALTGRLPDDATMMDPRNGEDPFVNHFTPKLLGVEWTQKRPVRILGKKSGVNDKQAAFDFSNTVGGYTLIAPSGHVFKALRFQPTVEGDDATMTVSIRLPGLRRNIFTTKAIPIREAGSTGVVVQNLPHCPILLADFEICVNNEYSPPVFYKAMSITAALEKVDNIGTLDIQCQDSCNFRVDVDGSFGRWMPGLVGPLSAGKHTITFRPVDSNSPCKEWTMKATVQPGRAIRVVGRLPLEATHEKPINTAWIGHDYGEPDLQLRPGIYAPGIQIDDAAIRLVWARGGDLWSAVSMDGNSFTLPRKLPLPVSSAWDESDPRLLRDESGRFILTFRSNRDGQHRNLIYVTWSRDFIDWSTPVMVCDRAYGGYDVVQDSTGRFVCAMSAYRAVKFMVSRDCYQWAPLPDGPRGQDPKLLCRPDGTLALFLTDSLAHEMDTGYMALPVFGQISRFVSSDGVHWSDGEILYQYKYDRRAEIFSVAQGANGSVVLSGTRNDASSSRWTGYVMDARVLMITEGASKWERTGEVPSLIGDVASLAIHPKWGYVLAWMSGTGGTWFQHKNYGPYLMRSHEMPAFFARSGKPIPASLVVTEFLPLRGKAAPGSRGANEKPATGKTPQVTAVPTPKPGELIYTVPWKGAGIGREIEITSAARFEKPRPGCGTVNPNAVVVHAQHNGLVISMALDATSESSLSYDVLRVDLTGKGDFTNAINIRRTSLIKDLAERTIYSSFEAKELSLVVDGRKVPASLHAGYVEGDTWRSLTVNLRTSAIGRCIMGDRLRTIVLHDTNHNLRIDRANGSSGVDELDYIEVPLGRWSASAGAFCGHPLMIDNELYDLVISPDGNSISSKKYEGPRGMLKIDHPFWTMLCVGDKSRYMIAGGTEPVPLPIGKHEVLSYREHSLGDPNKPHHVVCSDVYVGDPSPEMEIREGQTTSLQIGSPVVAKLIPTVTGRTVTFRYTERDTAGMKAIIEHWWAPDAHGDHRHFARIVTDQGRPVARIELDVRDPEWTPPKELSGTFTATVETDSGPYIKEPATTTFTVK